MIFVVGETARGKDAFGKLLQEHGFHPVVSYTTRPMRENETNGVEHYFITQDEAAKYQESDEIIAHTQIGEFEYFATKSEFDDKDYYIIDPNGIEWMKEHFPEVCKDAVTIYITCEKHLAYNRAKERGDDMEAYEARCKAEKEQFSHFNYLKDWDYQYANNGSLMDMEEYVKVFVKTEMIKEIKAQKEAEYEA